MNRLILTLLACTMCIAASAQQKPSLKFNPNGRFKIVQLTDLHWDNKSPGCDQTREIVKAVVKAEKPDLIILTGDIVTAPPASEGWQAIADMIDKTGTPWAILFGNHDGEAGLTYEAIFELCSAKPNFMGATGDLESGCGNYDLPIAASKGSRTAAVIYCLDSHNKPAAFKLGDYDWIHADQIDWYRRTGAQYASRNGGSPVPSLAFFHIPLMEYRGVAADPATVGNRTEGVASPDINSGMFCAMLESGDVMGVFTGHDHDNDFIGKTFDIALGYGRCSGADAYGNLERGARVIDLYEDSFRFDTWIRTPEGTEFEYYFPSGLTRAEEEQMTYLPASKVKPKEHGISYTYYEGTRFKHTSHIDRAREVKNGVVESFSLKPALVPDSMAFVYRTWLRIPEKGVYNFYTYSDDGSVLLIDGQMVVDNDGSHSLRRADGKVALDKGFHMLEVRYFQDYMGKGLEVGLSSRDIREMPIPLEMMYTEH